MKRIFIYIVLLFSLNFYCDISYSVEDRRKVQPQAPPTQYQPSPQETRATRPILPPSVPASSLGVSPTPSPHIAAPPVAPGPMSTPSFPADSQFPRTTIPRLPSVPAHTTVPITNIPTELPQVPIIGNSLGRVISKGSEEDGTPWIEVKDELFDEILKIKINPKSTPVIKKTTVVSFKAIKIGDMVNVIFNQEGEEISANFISILTEEDLKAMEESLKSGPTIAPEKEDSLPSEE